MIDPGDSADRFVLLAGQTAAPPHNISGLAAHSAALQSSTEEFFSQYLSVDSLSHRGYSFKFIK